MILLGFDNETMADYFKQRTASLYDLSKEFCNWMAQLTSCVNLHETTGGGGGEVNNWLTIVKKKKKEPDITNGSVCAS